MYFAIRLLVDYAIFIGIPYNYISKWGNFDLLWSKSKLRYYKYTTVRKIIKSKYLGIGIDYI